MEGLPPPPSYDEIMGPRPTPSAPPLGENRYEQQFLNPQPGLYAAYGGVTVTAAQTAHSGGPTTLPAPVPRDQRDVIERYVSYSVPAKLYSHTCGRHKDDEPGNPRTAVSCCASSALCCCGAVLVMAFLILPIAMFVTSILSFNICIGTGNPISKLLPLYLAVGGILLGLLVCLRTSASLLTCCRNKGRRPATPGSHESKVCVCLCEIFMAMWALANLTLLGAVSYYLLKDFPSGSSYCTRQYRYYYYLTVSYLFLQYLLYPLSCLFCCLAYLCQRSFR